MYDRFGEFNSAEEINRVAKAQMEEGDTNAIRILAEENGLDPQDAEDYITGVATELCTPLMAAVGKIAIESKELSIFGAFEAWRDFILSECEDDPDFTKAVRRKGKSLTEALAKVLQAESKGRKTIDSKIAKAAAIPVNTQMSTLTFREQKKILREYYNVAPVQPLEEGA